MKYTCLVILSFLVFGCSSKSERPSAEDIINKAIHLSGGEHIAMSTIAFDFRDKHYKAIRSAGNFQLERQFMDSTSHAISIVKDVLNNTGFRRFVDDLYVEILEEKAAAYSASVNSVHYFSILPYGLNDKAVNKVLLEDCVINGKNYHVIKVTFDEENGGEDYEDVFMYWINKKSNLVDYLAYSYNESDGKGIRFREAYNERYIKGIRFVDYNNYKPDNMSINLTDLPKLFQDGSLSLLSTIELKNLRISIN